MSISPEFKEFVDAGALIQIRSYLANYLIVDQTFETFSEAFDYANSHLSVLQEHDNAPLELDSSKWDEDYLNKQLVAVVSNFSKTRLDHIKTIIREVLSETNADDKVVGESVTYEKKKSYTGKTVIEEKEIPNGSSHMPSKKTTPYRRVQSTGNSSNPNRTGRRTMSEIEKKTNSDDEKTEAGIDLGSAMIVGGAVVAVIGVAAVKPVVIGAGVAIAGAGVATKANNRKK